MKRLLTGSALVLAVSFVPACDKKEEGEKKTAAAGDDKKQEAGAAKDGAEKADGVKADGGEKAEGDKGGIAGVVAGAAGGAGGGDLLKYIPDGANMIVVFDAKAVFGSTLFTENKAMIEQGDAGKMFAAADGCKVGPSTWNKVVLGGDTEGNDKIVMGGQATGLGKKETLECIAKVVNEREGSEKWKVSEADGRVVVDIEGGKATGWSGGDDVFIIAGKDYAETVKSLVAGEGKSAADGSLKDALATADTSKHVYFAGVAKGAMAEGPTAGLKHFSGNVDFSKGLAIAASMDFGDEAKATSTATMFSTQFQGLKGMAGGMGIPQPIVDSVKIEAKGSAVTASVSASAADLAKIAELAAKQMGA